MTPIGVRDLAAHLRRGPRRLQRGMGNRWARRPAAILATGLAASSAPLLSGCGCDADLRARVAPLTKTLRVGERFTPAVQYRGCGDTRPLSDVVTWSSEDPTIASTNGETGETTGRAVGTTRVVGVGAKHTFPVRIPVTVTP